MPPPITAGALVQRSLTFCIPVSCRDPTTEASVERHCTRLQELAPPSHSKESGWHTAMVTSGKAEVHAPHTTHPKSLGKKGGRGKGEKK